MYALALVLPALRVLAAYDEVALPPSDARFLLLPVLLFVVVDWDVVAGVEVEASRRTDMTVILVRS